MGFDPVDIAEAETVEVLIRADGSVVWINVDGLCRLRACRVKNIVINDERHKNG